MAATGQPIHGDLSRRVAVETAGLEWQPSPSGTVWRKRLHLVGGVESGQVTSIVRYEPNSRFSAHDHPEGEEILVLRGTFQDEHGGWPAGTYLLNPEGFRHAPFSDEGCELFVKLRQYAGARHHVALRTHDLEWQRGPDAGIEVRPLYAEPDFPDEMRLERWAPGAAPGRRDFPGGVELLVLEGAFEDEHGAWPTRAWLRLPAGTGHTPASRGGCELYVKTGALPSLRSA